jgi:phage FluMu protein Com
VPTYRCRACGCALSDAELLALPDDDCPRCGAAVSFEEVAEVEADD